MKILSILTLSIGLLANLLAPVRSQTEAAESWQMPQAEKTQWLQMLQSLAPTGDWTVSNRGNDFIIEHNTPVPFCKPSYVNTIPGSPQSRAKDHFGQKLRLTLRFSPLLSDEERLKRENQNVVAQEENKQIMEEFQIERAFGEFIISGQDAPARLREYQNEAQKLISYRLPQLYSGDRDVLVSRSWVKGSIDDTTPTGVECAQVLENIRAHFKAHQHRASYIGGVTLDASSPHADIYWLNLDEETANRPLYPVKVSVWNRSRPNS